MTKVFDCITFFNENFITNLRFEILNEAVDYFVICESMYDHQGKVKELNFKLKNKNFENKIIYLTLDKPFNENNDPWKNQAIQREYILEKLNHLDLEDYIMFSDPDEIPDPKLLKNIELKKRYGIFLQKMYCYKFNLYNEYESPWEGTRICKKKNLKSINFMRQKVVTKNLKKSFWKFYKEKVFKYLKMVDGILIHYLNLKIFLQIKSFAHMELNQMNIQILM